MLERICLNVHIWNWLDTAWHLIYSVSRSLLRIIYHFNSKTWYILSKLLALLKKVFIIVITDTLKFIFIKAEDLAFSTNIQMPHYNMCRWVCFSHYPDAGLLKYGNIVSFSSAQLFLFYFFDGSAFSFLVFLYEAFHWVMESPDWSSRLIFFSHYQDLYSFVLSSKDIPWKSNQCSLCSEFR